MLILTMVVWAIHLYNNNTNYPDWMSYGTQWGPADGPGGNPALHVSGAAQPETLQSQGEVFIFFFDSTTVSTSNS